MSVPDPPASPSPAQPPHSQPPQLPHAPQAPVGTEQWAWVRPATEQRTVETEPLPYHRLLRGMQNYRWWKPLLLLLVSGVYFGVFTVVLTLAFVPMFVFGDTDVLAEAAVDPGVLLDTQRPMTLLFSLLSIIVMLPSVLLAMLTLGIKPMGRVWSVATRIRWGLLGKTLGAAVAALVVSTVVTIVVNVVVLLVTDPDALTNPAPAATETEFSVNAALISLLLVILLVPLQAATEEVVFRGLFMQVIGAWVKNPWVAILIPTVAFAAMHIYEIWGLLAVGLMGLAAAWITWRTGGLEAAIAIHIVNNLVGFGFMLTGAGGSTAQEADGGNLGGVIGQVFGLSIFVWLSVVIFKRGGYGRERIDLVQIEVPAAPADRPADAPFDGQAEGPAGVHPTARPEERRNG